VAGSGKPVGGVFGRSSIEPLSRGLAHGIEPATCKLIMYPLTGIDRRVFTG
jgi:hypothetical protein